MVIVCEIYKFKMAFSDPLACEARRNIHAIYEVILLVCDHTRGWNARRGRRRGRRKGNVGISGTMTARHFCMYG